MIRPSISLLSKLICLIMPSGLSSQCSFAFASLTVKVSLGADNAAVALEEDQRQPDQFATIVLTVRLAPSTVRGKSISPFTVHRAPPKPLSTIDKGLARKFPCTVLKHCAP
ncbi:hypothetical protein WA026_012666 [Henosepilachna vigintioctopunctata]|uniref:Secreted protein n=1 Tax=Henosepilachna vigintioctopunctata TaxID=420089 RepID=A0AAW1TXP2_9CUCU